MKTNTQVVVHANIGTTSTGEQIFSCTKPGSKEKEIYTASMLYNYYKKLEGKTNVTIDDFAKLKPVSKKMETFAAWQYPSDNVWGKDFYMIMDANGHVKVGRSGSPGTRLLHLQSSSGSALTLAKVWPGMGEFEGVIKRSLKQLGYHSHGEWHINGLTPAVIDALFATEFKEPVLARAKKVYPKRARASKPGKSQVAKWDQKRRTIEGRKLGMYVAPPKSLRVAQR